MKNVKIWKFKEGQLHSIADPVAEERSLHVQLEPEVAFDVIITPEDIKEFVIGNLFSEGFIRSKTELLEYNERIKNGLIQVNVKLKDFSLRKQFFKKNYNITWTECGSSSNIKRPNDQLEPFKSSAKLEAGKIIGIFDIIQDKIEYFKQTGAFHYAFLFNNDFKLIAYAYDIGRHNAIDKVLGKAMVDNDDKFEDKVLFITGRISSDIILKCIRAGVPTLISNGAPFDTAIELANKFNVCLIGFLRNRTFNIYSNFKRVYK